MSIRTWGAESVAAESKLKVIDMTLCKSVLSMKSRRTEISIETTHNGVGRGYAPEKQDRDEDLGCTSSRSLRRRGERVIYGCHERAVRKSNDNDESV